MAARPAVSRDRRPVAKSDAAPVAGLACRFGACLLASLLAAPAGAASDVATSPPDADGLLRHLRALESIAVANGGNRAAGTAGYDRSVDYVAGQLRTAGYDVRFQDFTFPFFEETAPPLLELSAASGLAGSDADGMAVRTLGYSGSGDVTGRIAPVDLGLGDLSGAPDGRPAPSTSGCEPEDFAGFDAGAIALLRRGVCTFQAKVDNAVAAGAAGAIILNEGTPRRTDLFGGQLQTAADIPVVAVGYATGLALARAAGVETGADTAAEGATARLAVSTRSGTRPSRNVIAETPTGDPDRVIMVGAHLDSVTEGPGINDNGSGVAAVLETALRVAELAGTATEPARLRFAFWGAEELGLIGSRHYVDRLSDAERDRIAAYLNLDMVGSPNHGRFFFGADGLEDDAADRDRSAAIAGLFREHFARQGLPAESGGLGGGSDHAAFAAAGIPVAGLFTGAGEAKSPAEARLFGGTAGQPFDPCYHQACDTVAKIDPRVLRQMADAAAEVLLTLAFGQAPPVDPPAMPPPDPRPPALTDPS